MSMCHHHRPASVSAGPRREPARTFMYKNDVSGHQQTQKPARRRHTYRDVIKTRLKMFRSGAAQFPQAPATPEFLQYLPSRSDAKCQCFQGPDCGMLRTPYSNDRFNGRRVKTRSRETGKVIGSPGGPHYFVERNLMFGTNAPLRCGYDVARIVLHIIPGCGRRAR